MRPASIPWVKTHEELADQFLPRTSEDETIEQAIERTEAFHAAAENAGIVGLPERFITRGEPASEAAVRAVEEALNTSLPAEYRSFLLTFGTLSFADDSVRGTHPAKQLVAKANDLIEALAWDDYALEDLEVFDPLDDVLALGGEEREPWDVTLTPPLVAIATSNDSNAVVIAPSLASVERPTPLFYWYHDEANVLEGFTPTLRGWVSGIVDEMIAGVVGNGVDDDE